MKAAPQTMKKRRKKSKEKVQLEEDGARAVTDCEVLMLTSDRFQKELAEVTPCSYILLIGLDSG